MEENEIFDEGYLYSWQGGSVGDSYPGGKVWFVGSRITREMEGAVRKIKLLNEEASEDSSIMPGKIPPSSE